MRIIATLILLLFLSIGINYTQYKSSKVDKLLISQQEVSLKENKKTIDELRSDKFSVEIAYVSALDKIKFTDKSFAEMTEELSKIGSTCKKPISVTKEDTKNVKATVDLDVIDYYHVLHSAYNLQNKN